MPFGYEILLDVHRCTVDLLDMSRVHRFILELVESVGMRIYGEPDIRIYGKGNAYGITAMTFLDMSSLVIHTTPCDRSVYIDLFSCKRFDQHVVHRAAKKWFFAEEVTYHYLVRG
jgi:S-adenosylmethionine/arginine decarboxylase-like enzyme